MTETEFSSYCQGMDEVKKRIEVINFFLNGDSNIKYPGALAESIAVQIRKILELVALTSLMANRSELVKFNKKFQYHSKLSEVLSALKKVNPDYYPKPLEVNTGMELKDITSGFLTQQDFRRLYASCSRILHIENPLKEAPDSIKFIKSVPAWISKIMLLLNRHRISLADGRMLVVTMKTASDGKVHAVEFLSIYPPLDT